MAGGRRRLPAELAPAGDAPTSNRVRLNDPRFPRGAGSNGPRPRSWGRAVTNRRPEQDGARDQAWILLRVAPWCRWVHLPLGAAAAPAWLRSARRATDYRHTPSRNRKTVGRQGLVLAPSQLEPDDPERPHHSRWKVPSSTCSYRRSPARSGPPPGVAAQPRTGVRFAAPRSAATAPRPRSSRSSRTSLRPGLTPDGTRRRTSPPLAATTAAELRAPVHQQGP